MMDKRIWFVAGAALSCVCVVGVFGCGRSRSSDALPECIDSRIASIREGLIRGGVGFDFLGESQNTVNLFVGLSNSVWQTQGARSYSQMLLAVDLVGMPYRVREGATCQYCKSVLECFWILRKCNVDPMASIEFLFASLIKYKESCLSVPTVDNLPGETHADRRKRRECARILRADYEIQMAYIRRSWLPHLSPWLPVEYHAEFTRRFDLLTGRTVQCDN